MANNIIIIFVYHKDLILLELGLKQLELHV